MRQPITRELAEAICDVLTGVVDPSGRMAVSTARCAGQIPIYYNHPNGSAWHQGDSIGFKNYVDCSHTPRYFFGYGLSYTTFEYSDLTVERSVAAPDETVCISAAVTNTGNRKGTEVVQLYVKDVYASMTRPVMELAGFKRVELNPGETRKVTFLLQPDQLAFLDEEMKWKIEKGRIEVFVGSSSREEDLKLRGSFEISADKMIEGRTRTFYARAQVSPE